MKLKVAFRNFAKLLCVEYRFWVQLLSYADLFIPPFFFPSVYTPRTEKKKKR